MPVLRPPTALPGLLLGLAMLFGGSAAEASDDAHARGLERWKGRTCTLGTCAPRPAAPAQHAAGFGTAVALCVWIARRRGGDD